jgi:hypothetical protein
MKEFSNNENIEEESAQRQRKRSKNIDGFLIMHHINEEDDQNKFRPLFFEILDIILIELNTRFSQNSDILDAIINAEDLNFQKSECLQKLGIKIPQKHEIMVVKSYLEKSNEEGDTFSKLVTTLLRARTVVGRERGREGSFERIRRSCGVEKIILGLLYHNRV